jgi:hypothetical protein
MEGGDQRASQIGKHHRRHRLLVLGTEGLSGVVALLLVLAPSAVGAAAHPSVVKTPPYRGTSSSGTLQPWTTGCGKVTGPALDWNSSSGMITGTNGASARSCKNATGPAGSLSLGYDTSSMTVGIPFKVSTSGSHAIATSISVTLTSARSLTLAACPKSLATHPSNGTTSASKCYASDGTDILITAGVIDLNTSSWLPGYGFWWNSSWQVWWHDTACFNYSGNTSCSRNGGWHNSSAASPGTNSTASFSFTSGGSIKVWTNETNMLPGHHYLLEVKIQLDLYTFVSWYNVAKKWMAASAASITMSGTGKGAKVASIAIS